LRVATDANADGHREVLTVDIGSLEDETFWIDFPRKLRPGDHAASKRLGRLVDAIRKTRNNA
jgi:transposase-like protein